ncbi:MAG: NAD-binding protein [Synechococcales bacterium]|nr:NAD-binding protein [Synechococcales bacterium]
MIVSRGETVAVCGMNNQGTAAGGGGDRVIVCGLGSLGQHCVLILKEFGVAVSAIERHATDEWEIPEVPDLLEQLLWGDCRRSDLLMQAQVQNCRAIVLATSDERVNIEAAFAARLLNPTIRLVVRSAKQNLNELLNQQFGNFAAFEPTQLSAPAFALAALDEDILGFFTLEGQLVQVVRRHLQAGDRWCQVRKLHELNTRTRRVLSHTPVASRLPTSPHLPIANEFYQWEPDAMVQAGDVLVLVEATPALSTRAAADPTVPDTDADALGSTLPLWRRPGQLLRQLWRKSYENQIRRVILICGLVVVGLLAVGTLLFWTYYPEASFVGAFYAAAVLLLGGFGDLFSDIPITIDVPWWLRLFGLLLTLAGTAFVGVLYAVLTEKLLTWRLQFFNRRPPVPPQNHVVIIGLGRVGRRVAALLMELKQSLVGIVETAPDPTLLPQMPLLSGDITATLAKANLSRSQSVVAVTEDEMQNLEMGLMVHAVNPASRLVIRTYNRRFSDRVAQLFPYAQVLCASALAAEAFVAAAFGENVNSLLRFGSRTVLVTEYSIEANDTLCNLLLADIAYGYGVVPILHQRSAPDALPKWMPSDDTRLHGGDRLVVLAAIDGLRQIEHGQLAPKRWQVIVETALTSQAAFDGAADIALVSGCAIDTARSLMAQLPAALPFLLYKHQAMRMVRRLSQNQVIATVKKA